MIRRRSRKKPIDEAKKEALQERMEELNIMLRERMQADDYEGFLRITEQRNAISMKLECLRKMNSIDRDCRELRTVRIMYNR